MAKATFSSVLIPITYSRTDSPNISVRIDAPIADVAVYSINQAHDHILVNVTNFGTGTITLTLKEGFVSMSETFKLGRYPTPIARADTVTTPANQSVVLSVLANDSAGVPDSALTIYQWGASGLGRLTNNNDGTFTWDANGEFDYLREGEMSLNNYIGGYRMRDSGGNSGFANMFVNVIGVNDAPKSLDFVIYCPSNHSVRVSNATLLQRAASDPENDSFSITAIDSSSINGAAITLDGEWLTYTPANNSTALTDTFNCTVTDVMGAARVISIQVVMARSITVTSSWDGIPGSLRAAISSASASIVDGHTWTIRFAPALAGQTLWLYWEGDDNTFGDSFFECANRIIVDGKDVPGLVIQRNSYVPNTRFFNVKPEGELTLRNLTLLGGEARGGEGTLGAGGGGGGVGFGGAIYNQGMVTLENVTLSQNQAAGGDGGAWAPGKAGIGGLPYGGKGNTSTNDGFGGGLGGSSSCGGSGGLGAGGAIFNHAGTVMIRNSLITGNFVTGGAGGLGESGCNGTTGQALGAGIFNLNGSVSVADSLFTNNAALQGAGIYSLGDGLGSSLNLGGVTITNSVSTNDVFLSSTNGGNTHLLGNNNHLGIQNAPWIQSLSDMGIVAPAGPLFLNFNVSSPTGEGTYSIAAVSDDQSLLPNSNLAPTAVSGSGSLTITPQAGKLGQTLITVTLNQGNVSTAETFELSLGLFAKCITDCDDRVIRFHANPGQTFIIEQTTQLLLPLVWVSLGTATEVAPGQFEYRHNAPNTETGFYRIVSQ